MAKRKLADVLWEAANVRLTPPRTRMKDGTQEPWSCNAALLAEFPKSESCFRNRIGIVSLRDRSQAAKFLESLGCNVRADNAFGFDYLPTDNLQGVRYMWLLLAMHVAEDEGITL